MFKEYALGTLMRRHGEAFIRDRNPHPVVRKAIRDIAKCRTPVLGGRQLECTACGWGGFVWNSCGNRNCPICQSIKKELWLDRRMKGLLPVRHFHVVFTLPHELNGLMVNNERWAYGALFRGGVAHGPCTRR